MQDCFHVTAEWDSEAGVWVASSDDVPGLATEAESPNELARKLNIMIPELLESNGVPHAGNSRFHIHYQHEEVGVLALA